MRLAVLEGIDLYRLGLVGLLEGHRLSTAYDGRQRFDAVIVSSSDATAALWRQVADSVQCPVLCVTMEPEWRAAFAIAEHPMTQGMVHRRADRAVFTGAVRAVAGGEVFVDSATRAVVRMARTDRLREACVTKAEAAVLELLARGRSNDRIAGELGCTVRTVKFHISNLLAKTRAGTRQGLVAWYLDVPGWLLESRRSAQS